MSKPRIAAFPKGYFDQLVARDPITIEDWISGASSLGIEGVELYPSFLRTTEAPYLAELRHRSEDVGMELPMMCSSPDFVDPHSGAWEVAVELMREMVDVMVELSPTAQWRSVRVLSGQRWPGVADDEGIARVVEGIEAVLPYASSHGVHVVMENHYKDGLWLHPEFAQASQLFLAIIEKIDSPWFGVNFDPSNAIVAGDDPLVLLDHVVERVVTMHASDRSLRPGFTLDDLAAHQGVGYPEALQHGVVGQGLNDYPAILSRLASEGFDGWISIEDGERGGEKGLEDIRQSARYLRGLIEQRWATGEIDDIDQVPGPSTSGRGGSGTNERESR